MTAVPPRRASSLTCTADAASEEANRWVSCLFNVVFLDHTSDLQTRVLVCGFKEYICSKKNVWRRRNAISGLLSRCRSWSTSWEDLPMNTHTDTKIFIFEEIHRLHWNPKENGMQLLQYDCYRPTGKDRGVVLSPNEPDSIMPIESGNSTLRYNRSPNVFDYQFQSISDSFTTK